MGDGENRAGFRGVLAVPEFRAAWAAQVLSVAGDQLARIALTLLVYQRTQSAVLAAVTFVAGTLPSFIGGTMFSGLGDRFPRRTVMLACDLIRAALVMVMVIPGLPLVVLVLLLCAVTAGNAPFISARSAIYTDFLAGERYVVASAITLTTSQGAQVLGFGAGGLIAGVFGTRTSLLADAGTFLISALLVRRGITARPAPGVKPKQAAPFADLTAGTRLVFGDPALRTPMLLAWLAAAYSGVPEGIATPFARELGGGAAATGLVLAVPAAGSVLAALMFSRLFGAAERRRLMAPLALVCCAVLIVIVLQPPLPVALLVLAVSGVCSCFQVAANASFVVAAPAGQRSQAMGIAIAGLGLGQGAAMIVAGTVAQYVAPTVVISVAGALGALVAFALMLSRRSRPKGIALGSSDMPEQVLQPGD